MFDHFANIANVKKQNLKKINRLMFQEKMSYKKNILINKVFLWENNLSLRKHILVTRVFSLKLRILSILKNMFEILGIFGLFL